MSLRPKRQLLASPEASLLNASTSPSIASTVPMLSPSVRRSARIQDSPSVSYRDSLRSSVMRDTVTPVRNLGRRRSRSRSRSRVFGLDVSDRSKLDRNSDSETEQEEMVPNFTPYQQQLVDKLVSVLHSPRGQGVAASLLLLVLLIFTQWVAGQGMTTVISAVVGPLSGLRVAVMSLPELVRGSFGRQSVDEVDIIYRMMNSDKMKEMLKRIGEESIGEIGKVVDRKMREEVKIVTQEVDKVRKMYVETEIRRLAMREEEIKMAKSRQEDEGDIEVGQDIRQKLELVEIQVEQLKISLNEATQQFRGKSEVAGLEEEVGSIRKVMEELHKDNKDSVKFEQELGRMKEQVNLLQNRNADLAKLEGDFEKVNRKLEEYSGGQGSSEETINQLISNMLADRTILENDKNDEQQNIEMRRLDELLNQLIIQTNQIDLKHINMLNEKVVSVTKSLEEDLVKLTNTLHNDWSKSQANNSVSLPQVSAMLESKLSLFSSDRTGQVDWASLAVGGLIISTPNTTTHPTQGQVFTVLGVPLFQHSSVSPKQILQPFSGAGQCWPFSGQTGQVVIKLGKEVRVTGVTIEHVRASPDLTSAPQNITVWNHDTNTTLLNLTYSISSTSVQTFNIYAPSPLPISKMRLEVKSNWGHPEFTCMYRVRVHGSKVEQSEKVISAAEPFYLTWTDLVMMPHVRIPRRE